MKRILIFVSVAALAGLLIFRFVEARLRAQPEQVQERVFPVQLAALERKDVPRVLVLTGNIRPLNTVEVAAKAGGRVESIEADLGDKVKKDQVLAVLEHREADLQVKQAEAGLAAAVANYKNAASEYERTKSLEAAGAVSRSQLDALLARLEASQAQKMQAEAALGLARESLRNSTIRSPIEGVVTRRTIDIGQLVSPGVPVYQVQSAGRMKFSAGVAAEDYTSIEKGMPVGIHVDSFPNEIFPGVIARVSPSLDPYSRRAALEVEIDNRDGRLLANMFARGVIDVGQEKDALILPVSAVIEDGETYSVFVAESGTAKKRAVQVKFRTDEIAVLSGGASVGEQIVTQGQGLLSDGAKIEPAAE